MWRRVGSLLFLIPFAAARAAVPPLLAEAIHKLVANEDHWAFTQKSQFYDRNGRPEGGLTVERYDPSLPYDRQWALELYRGRVPTASDLSAWKERKQRLMKHKGEKGLGDVLDLEQARPFSQDALTTTFLVPIQKGASKRFPADKLEVFMDVDRKLRALRGFSLRPKGPFRIAGVVKVDEGEVDGRLEVVEARYAPVLVWVKGSGSGHLFHFFRIGQGEEVTYDDFKRVHPYDDRFQVKIGDIKALDF